VSSGTLLTASVKWHNNESECQVARCCQLHCHSNVNGRKLNSGSAVEQTVPSFPSGKSRRWVWSVGGGGMVLTAKWCCAVLWCAVLCCAVLGGNMSSWEWVQQNVTYNGTGLNKDPRPEKRSTNRL